MEKFRECRPMADIAGVSLHVQRGVLRINFGPRRDLTVAEARMLHDWLEVALPTDRPHDYQSETCWCGEHNYRRHAGDTEAK